MALLAAVTLGFSDFALIGGMLAAFAGLMTTLMLANLKGLGRRIDQVEQRIGKVERCKADQRDIDRAEMTIGELRKEKADKHEVYREDLLARDQRQELGKQLQRIEAKLQTDFGVAGMMSQLVKELKKLNGTPS